MFAPSCLANDCWDFYTTYQGCTGSSGGDMLVTSSMISCLCASNATAEYDQCYPCLITDPGYEDALLPAEYTLFCSFGGSAAPFTVNFPSITAGGATPNSTGTINNTNNTESNHTAMYIGIGVGVGVVITVATLSVAFFFYRRNRKNILRGNNPVEANDAGPPDHPTTSAA
ncbi:hypothetical protein BGZ58_011013 [Dissophora ornata]|nr:hypothetical protein BGZ58_011013 [Dissophora ornata]